MSDGVHDGAPHGVGGGGEAIVDPQALLPPLDQTRAAQVRQVAGGFRLRNLQRLVDVADAHLAAEEQAQDAEPGAVGQRFEQRLQRPDLGRARVGRRHGGLLPARKGARPLFTRP